MRRTLLLFIAAAAMLITACAPSSRRSEIEQRREALKHKQDSALASAQTELAEVDAMLQQAQADYDLLMEELHTATGRTTQQNADMERRLTEARLTRDSLQLQFDVLCGKIKYIHRRQQELNDSAKETPHSGRPQGAGDAP